MKEPKNIDESLKYIYKEQKELSTLGGIGALLGWDQMTYMPKGGNEDRAEHLSLLSRLTHERAISDTFYSHITTLCKPQQYEKLNARDKLVVTRLKHDIEKARKIPPEFVERMAKVTTLSYAAWQESKKADQYHLFAPHLKTIIELEREYSDFIALPGHPYNSLLDDFEEGMTVDTLKNEFSSLKKNLHELLEKITASERYQKQQLFEKHGAREQQQKICQLVLKQLDISDDCSRLDVSMHPFTTTIGSDDVRMTTNFDSPALLSSFFSTVHESGHVLYELGLPRGDLKDTILSDSPSLGLHESQSRFWENMIARSLPFWHYFYPLLQQAFPDELQTIPVDEWYCIVNQVRPSCIRVEADELTYCLHVILRFELEMDLIDDKFTVAELPAEWNDKMKELLGITPKSDREGVLQDMHWSTGEFGYFPTYAIGTMYAAQLFNQFSRERPDLSRVIEKGGFAVLLRWLRVHVHQLGRTMTAEEIIKNTCGEGLNSKIYIDYLTQKYSKLYDI